MKQLVRKPEDSIPEFYRHDVQRIREILNRDGYDASPEDIMWGWEKHSDTYAAGWLGISDDEGYSYNFEQAASIVRMKLTEKEEN